MTFKLCVIVLTTQDLGKYLALYTFPTAVMGCRWALHMSRLTENVVAALHSSKSLSQVPSRPRVDMGVTGLSKSLMLALTLLVKHVSPTYPYSQTIALASRPDCAQG